MKITSSSADTICLDARTLSLDNLSLLTGNLSSLLPRDKSTTHRLILLSSMIRSTCIIESPLISYDTIATYNAVVKLGVKSRIQFINDDGSSEELTDGLSLVDPDELLNLVENKTQGVSSKIRIVSEGCIFEPLAYKEPKPVRIDCLGSGTTARLLSGVLCGVDQQEFLIDGSSFLKKRPMEKLVRLLRGLKASIQGSPNERYLPLLVRGSKLNAGDLISIDQGSAQLKSAVILAMLNTPSHYRISLPAGSRRSTELILKELFSLNSAGSIETFCSCGVETIEVNQSKKVEDFNPFKLQVLTDPSSLSYIVSLVSFFTQGLKIEFNSLLYEKDRFSWVDVLAQMGLGLSLKEDTIHKTFSLVVEQELKLKRLHSVTVSEGMVPSLIDELPLIMGLACFCDGVSKFCGIQSLRTKESDRVEGIIRLCRLFGVECQLITRGVSEDLCIYGKGLNGVSLLNENVVYDSFFDHRLVMSALVCGMCSYSSFKIQGVSSIRESFPSFFKLISKLFI